MYNFKLHILLISVSDFILLGLFGDPLIKRLSFEPNFEEFSVFSSP